MGGWRSVDKALKDAGATYDAAPLTEREAVLERSELPPRNWSRGLAPSLTPEAIAKRAERARRRQQQAPG